MIKFAKIFCINLLCLFLIGILYYIIDVSIYDNGVLKIYSPDTTCYDNDRLESKLPFDKSKKPVIFVGCSFVYGFFIDEKDTLSYKIQQKTGRKTYNRGYIATGIQHVLYNLKYSDFYKKHSDLNPEYFVYVFIPDHIRRMYINYFSYSSNDKFFKYEQKGDDVEPMDLKIRFSDYVKKTHIAKSLNYNDFAKKSNDETFDFLKLHLKKFEKEVHEKYPNSKIAIIIYNDKIDNHGQKIFSTNRWNELEKMGFVVLNFNDYDLDFLNGEEYRANKHPNGKAWDSVVPIIISKLKL